jgi:hypothetical protein
MNHVVILAAIFVMSLVTLVGTSSEVSAKRVFDNPNYGYCHGSLRRVGDVTRCRRPGPYSGFCPAGKLSKRGTRWAHDVRNCR